ncbi:hypothetical protein ACFSCX_09655 [Bacillus salitolerans]|uniref:DUF5067 domain-containing protein n=1 Tax=Bacillus salitolerans TaxID=1437434 RepID=A0ABW4LPB4_9BACI
MKRLLLVGIMFSILALAACQQPVGEISVETEVEPLTTVDAQLQDDQVVTKNYQGYINVVTKMDDTDFKKITKLVVRDIQFADSEIGIPVVYRFNPELTEDDIRAIYVATMNGNVNTSYEYLQDDFTDYGLEKTEKGEYTTKLQYIILQAPAETQDLSNEVSFIMEYHFEDETVKEKELKVEL